MEALRTAIVGRACTIEDYIQSCAAEGGNIAIMDGLVSQFVAVTGASVNEAKQMLEV